VIGLTRADVDVLDADRIRARLVELAPTHVLNTTAYNLVDRAEEDPGPAFALNATAVGMLAETCERLGATFVHFSTDYVFDGRARTPYRETAPPNPLSRYGESKVAGERLALERCGRTFVFRVCGLYGLAGRATRPHPNFVQRMLSLAREGRALRVVSDQIVAPSYTRDLAAKVWQVLGVGEPGLYHLTSGGETSWYDFVREAFRLRGIQADLTPVTAAEFGARAARPAYSVLAHDRLRALGLDDLRPWSEALPAYLAEPGV
jgi:dTDP-4-dehydrorhamnose reductase